MNTNTYTCWHTHMYAILICLLVLCSFFSQSCTGCVHLEVARFKAGVQYSHRCQVKCFSYLLISDEKWNIDIHEVIHHYWCNIKTKYNVAFELYLFTLVWSLSSRFVFVLFFNVLMLLSCKLRNILSFVLSRVKTLTVQPWHTQVDVMQLVATRGRQTTKQEATVSPLDFLKSFW